VQLQCSINQRHQQTFSLIKVWLQQWCNSSPTPHGNHAAAASSRRISDSSNSDKISATASDLNAAVSSKESSPIQLHLFTHTIAAESAARLPQRYHQFQSTAAIAQCARASFQLQLSVPSQVQLFSNTQQVSSSTTSA
jgi:hypothetical protein